MKKQETNPQQNHQETIKQPLLEKEIPQQPAPRVISLWQLFKFADQQDIIYMIFGSIGALGSGAVMPMFSYFFGNVSTNYQSANPIHASLHSSIQFFILGGCALVLNFFGTGLWTLTGQRQSVRYRKLYYKLLLDQQVKWYDGINPNSLSTRVSNQISAIQGAIGQKIAVIQSVLVTCLLGFILAYFKNWRLSLVLTATLPAIAIAAIINMKAIQTAQQKNGKTFSQAGAISQQSFNSIRTVKALVGQEFQLQKFDTRLYKGLKQGQKYNYLMGAGGACMVLVFFAAYALAFWYGKVIIIHHPKYNVASVMSAIFCIIIGGSQASQASPALKNIGQGRAAATKIFELYERIPTLIEKQDAEQIQSIDEIVFEDVTFNYKPDVEQRNVLEKLSLKIPKNKVTAICGESGSGKSTVVQLVQRFYDPLSGRVLINGKDLKQLDVQSYRRQIGYVGQQPSLFAISIKENLLLAKQTATDEEIIAALKQSNAYEFVRTMENGINTFVGASGAQISGGQKQRIAIARAILKNPSLYIFDQATSALDRKNQKLIQQTLKKISSNNTTLVIAHRLSTIQDADNIIVLNKGVIMQQGTHQELYDKKSYYYDLIKNQIQANENEDEQPQEQVLVKFSKKSSSVTTRKNKDGQLENTQQQDPDRQKKEGQVFYKLFNQSKQSLIHYILGSFYSLINGATLPVFSLLLSHMLGLLYQIRDHNTSHKNTQIDNYCIGFVGLAVASGLTAFGYNVTFSIIGEKLVYKLRIKLFNKLLKQQVKFYDQKQNNPGALSSKLAQDAYTIKNLTTNIIATVIMNFSTAITGLIIAFYYYWAVALIVLGLCPLMIVGAFLNVQRMKRLSKKAQEAYTQAGALISDTVCNIRTVKSLGKKSTLIKRFDDSLIAPFLIAKDKALEAGIFQGIAQSMTLFVYGLIYYLAAIINSHLHKDAINIFASIFAIVFGAYGLANNSRFMSDIAKSKNAGVSIFQIIESKDQYQKAVQQGGVQKTKIQGEIQLKNIVFKYPSREKKVFKNLNLKIQKNTKVAFVGSSGCGKSTIFQLLMRYYQPESGQILIDGKNIKSYDLYHLRGQYGLVSQQPPLFIGNIQENVKYKNVNKTFQEVVRCTKIASAHQFIETLSEEKYQKQVGNKGGQLSGGQKQRIAIARCLLAQPSIFMFDESTSALDLDTERTVFNNLKEVTKGKTTLSIAHRISTIVDSDQILVFDVGKIVQTGTYNELTSAKGYFYRLERGQN